MRHSIIHHLHICKGEKRVFLIKLIVDLCNFIVYDKAVKWNKKTTHCPKMDRAFVGEDGFSWMQMHQRNSYPRNRHKAKNHYWKVNSSSTLYGKLLQMPWRSPQLMVSCRQPIPPITVS